VPILHSALVDDHRRDPSIRYLLASSLVCRVSHDACVIRRACVRVQRNLGDCESANYLLHDALDVRARTRHTASH
jgi:hypothetical protein